MADRPRTDRDPDIRDDVPVKAPDEAPGWLDRAGNVRKVFWGVCGLSALLLAVDPLVHKHGYFEAEHWFGFYGLYAFVCCAALVLGGKALRKLVMRPEDYYDR